MSRSLNKIMLIGNVGNDPTELHFEAASKALLTAISIVVVLSAMTSNDASAQQDTQQNTLLPDYPNNYTMYDDVVSMPAGRVMGSGNAVDVDSRGNIWVFERCGGNQGACLQSDVDPVLKFSPEGEVLMVLGTPGETGAPPTHFTDPNDVLVAPDGSIFVGDTHGAQFQSSPGPDSKSRISKFAPDGTFIMSFGQWGYGDGEFRAPHSLAMDSQGRLFVADRGNRRSQIFDQQGNHLDTWYQFSRISGLFIDDNDVLYAIDSESGPNYNPGWRKGLRVGSARTGEVWYFVPEHVSERASGMGGFGSMGEGVTVDAEGNVYGGEVGPVQGLTKFIPRLISR